MRKPGRPKGTKKNGMKYLNERQLKALISTVEKGKNLRDEIMIKLTLWLGLRVREVTNIKLEHISLDSREISIKAVKNGRRRTYQFDEEKNQKLWKKLVRYIKSVKKTNSIYLFPVYANRAGLSSDFSVHCLRHSTGVLMAKARFTAIQIQLWLRHRSILSSQRYFEQTRFEEDSRRTAEEFQAYL